MELGKDLRYFLRFSKIEVIASYVSSISLWRFSFYSSV